MRWNAQTFNKFKRELEKIRGTKRYKTYRLGQEQIKIVEKMGFVVEPYLYLVRTRTFSNVKERHIELRKLHYLKKNEIHTKIMQLTDEQKLLFKKNGVKFEEFKQKVSDKTK